MELARLLHYPTTAAALTDTAGLLVQDGAVRFKGPQRIAPFQPPSHLRAIVDSIVLSTMQKDNLSPTITITNANNKTVIGRNVAGTVIGGYAAWSNLSDGRFKENIQNDVPGLAFINALEPVTYVISLEKLDQHLTQMMPDSVAKWYYKSEEEYAYNRTIRHTGFIAQDVEKAAEKTKSFCQSQRFST